MVLKWTTLVFWKVLIYVRLALNRVRGFLLVFKLLRDALFSNKSDGKNKNKVKRGHVILCKFDFTADVYAYSFKYCLVSTRSPKNVIFVKQ